MLHDVPGARDQNAVAGLMTVSIINGLEMVQIHHGHTAWHDIALDECMLLTQDREKERAAVDPREGIDMRAYLQVHASGWSLPTADSSPRW